ncbi:MAG: DUF420 domain-containing protein [Chromatiaceae bacterium]|nr:DUF420 domain-containing protein [Gammaproteobacteria bacterium]MCB1881477.1 DUF420 domain-containing protein [Gammaproteobacteria bacterium]MCP5428367.1 DUF420 domain-containing protein [Chromatiaceae bacterium]MCP5446116.1 DUF420 domain-containing protein [Chromatiaceae bacterium]
MDITSYLPPLQATLNAISACLIVAAYVFIRKGDKRAHKICMVSALVVSTLFLVSYLYYHSQVGYMPFSGQGFIRPIYFLILFSHIILAVVILPMIVLTVTFALRDRIALHQRITRWTLPLWLYVSVTGVLIYLFGFHLYPPQI